MTNPLISTEDPSYRKYISVLDTKMAYVDVGNGDPIVFLHGVPTPSYPIEGEPTPPNEVGDAIARFVQKVLAGQIGRATPKREKAA